MAIELVLPEPSEVRLAQLRTVVIPRIREARKACTQVDEAREIERCIQALRKYVDDKEARKLLEAEEVRTRVLIGKLLGAPRIGSHHSVTPEGARLHKDERLIARKLADHEDRVEELLDQGVTSSNRILQEVAPRSQMVTRMTSNTGEYEWYTPRKYLDSAAAVMGAIDLDPASSDRANDHVGAEHYYTEEEDGASPARRWFGHVFLNPPYAMPMIRQFIDRIVAAWNDREIDAGILLTNDATDTEWFHLAASACTLMCFTRGRIRFLEAGNGHLVERPSPMVGQIFFYFGDEPSRFQAEFSKHGMVLCRC